MIGRSNGIALLTVAALATFAGANALRPALDADTGWHLRIGQFIDRSGTVPDRDPIARIGHERELPWQAYSWLHEWLLHRCFVLDRERGILIFRTGLVALSTASVFAFLFSRFGYRLVAFPISLVVSITLAPMATERPWHVTIAFTTCTLWAVLAARETGSTRAAIALIPLFALWANVHIQFVLGWIVLGFWCVDPGRTSRRTAVLATTGCVLATVANPYHVRLLVVIWDYATQAAPRGLIHELAPPDVLGIHFLAVAALALTATTGFAIRRRADVFEIGLLVAVVFVGMRMNRDLWFGALLAVAAMRPPAANENPVRSWTIVATVCGTLFAMRLLNAAGLIGDNDTAAAHVRIYPVRAVEFIRETRPAGPLFNDITWGGYLAWALPEYPVTIDGRTNLYGNERLLQSSRTWSTENGWTTDGELPKCNIVLARADRPFARVLRARPEEWRIAHEDPIAIVFVRR
jgi:hypothetical protein